MSKMTTAELEKYLWDAVCVLRGSMGAGSYKNYIFPMLFFKRLCDVYDEEYRIAMEESGNDTEYAASKEVHPFLVPTDAHWNTIRNVPSDVGTAISKAMKKIESVNPRLIGIFGDAAWTNKNRLPDDLLKDLIEHLSSKVLSLENCPEDELGNGYEYLIGKFADDSGHTAQEFYTNRTIVHLMTELLKPQPGESVYDPTCGSGGMLISTIAYLRDHGLEWRSVKLYGQELTPLTASIGKMNLILHGVKEFRIEKGDTLEEPKFIENGKLKQFNMVLANPPYSISSWNRTLFQTDPYGRNFLGVPPQGRADYAFFQHILKSMDPENGRCAILFPHGVLSREEEKAMRKKLIELDLIECVIGVAKGLFYNSPMEACIVICKSNKSPEMKGKIKIIDAKKRFKKEGKNIYLRQEDIDHISALYDNPEEVEFQSKIVTISEVIDNDAKLIISKYVQKDRKASDVNESFRSWLESSEDDRRVTEELVLSIKGGN